MILKQKIKKIITRNENVFIILCIAKFVGRRQRNRVSLFLIYVNEYSTVILSWAQTNTDNYCSTITYVYYVDYYVSH